jgi:hypothetical protein
VISFRTAHYLPTLISRYLRPDPVPLREDRTGLGDAEAAELASRLIELAASA